IRHSREDEGRRAAIHCSGGCNKVVTYSGCCATKTCCCAGVVQGEIEEGRISGQQLSSRAALESYRACARRERAAVGPIASESKSKSTGGEGRSRDDVEIACDDGVALQRLGAGSRNPKPRISRCVVNCLRTGSVVVNLKIRQRLVSDCVLRQEVWSGGKARCAS